MPVIRPKYLWLFLALGLGLAIVGASDVLAQNPFGAPRPSAVAPPAPPPDGIVGWIAQKQSEFYLLLRNTVRSAKTDGSAAWLLMGIAFLYGIFHAAGPGHGKAVISGYLVANEETWRRGVVLSFLSALLQAIVAVLIVGIAAAVLNVTAPTMGRTVYWIEIISYTLIALIGARLLWVKGRAFIAEWARLRAPWVPPPRWRTNITITTITIIMITRMVMTTGTTITVMRITITRTIRMTTHTRTPIPRMVRRVMCTTSTAAIRMARRRISLPVPAAGSGA